MLIKFSELRDGRLRKLHMQRLQSLSNAYSRRDLNIFDVVGVGENSSFMPELRRIAESYFYNKFSFSQIAILITLLVLSFVFVLFLHNYLFLLSPVIVVLSFNYWNQRLVKARQVEFINEYPAVLLATASNLKAGLSVYSALERAIQLLDEKSSIKSEVQLLLEKVTRGVPKEQAVNEFVKGIDLPELRLFKRAFILVLVHGGKFSRTLERLSEVCRDRDSLIKSANVSTASMRMTANVLLAIAPLLMLMLSLRTKNFWTTLFENNTASAIGLSGASIILGAFFILRKLSDFKP